MKDLRNVITLCRDDPEVAGILLQIVACLYGMFAFTLAYAIPNIDHLTVGWLMGGYVLPSTDADAAWIGRMTLYVGVAYLALWAVVMAVAGIGVDVAHRYGVLPGRRL